MKWTEIYRQVGMATKSAPLNSVRQRRAGQLLSKIRNHLFLNLNDFQWERFESGIISCEDCLGTGYEDGMTAIDYETYGARSQRKPCKTCKGTGDQNTKTPEIGGIKK